MDIQHDVSLQPYNTFGLDQRAEYFCQFTSTADLSEALAYRPDAPRLILGGGSNILLTSDVSGMVMRNVIDGIEVVKETDTHWHVKAGGGVVWHDFVMHCIDNGYAGVENLSLIPGSCGAAPMQNIGAYGVELKEVFQSLEAYHIASGEVHEFNREECKFGYRESVFKREKKGEYIICSVTFILRKVPEFKTSYGAIVSELERMKVESPSIKAISDAVISIRQSKLPDPKEIGNSGSFFKNPVIATTDFDTLLAAHPTVPNYPAPDGRKIAAGWLIEQAGWKGKTFGNYGVHDRQALVLVNHGGAKGADIYTLSSEIIQSVNERFGVRLEREVNIVGNL